MATYQILSWHGIPTGVRARDEEGMASENLPLRFQAAVDAAATETGHVGTKEYLAGWNWSEKVKRDGSAREAARAVALEVEEDYPPERIKILRREITSRLNGHKENEQVGK